MRAILVNRSQNFKSDESSLKFMGRWKVTFRPKLRIVSCTNFGAAEVWPVNPGINQEHEYALYAEQDGTRTATSNRGSVWESCSTKQSLSFIWDYLGCFARETITRTEHNLDWNNLFSAIYQNIRAYLSMYIWNYSSITFYVSKFLKIGWHKGEICGEW